MSVVVTGLGGVCALGNAPDKIFAALCDGRSGIEGAGPFRGKGPVAAFPGGPHLSSEFAEHAVKQALGDLAPARVGLVGASTSGDMVEGEIAYGRIVEGYAANKKLLWPQLCDRPVEIVARKLGFGGPRLTVSTACTSGAVAVGIAAEWVRSGRAKAVVAVGADALCRMTVHGFGSLGAMSPDQCRPFDQERTGLSLGEGAGALLIEDEAHALARNATPLARILGYGNASDAHHMTAPHPDGRGARMAVRQAGIADVDWICAHGTATPLNDAMEAPVLNEEVPGACVSSIKGAIGHTLGAAGALELMVSVLALVEQRVPPNTGCRKSDFDLDLVMESRQIPLQAVLSVNFAFGGHNAAVRVGRC